MSRRTHFFTQPTLPSLNIPLFPSTRYQGSKLKLLDWIWANIRDLPFDTALDAFGGTGCVSHLLKSKGKQVAYNDVLEFNYIIGLALIENDATTLSEEDVAFLLTRHESLRYPTFIQDTFYDIYFTDDENRWLDMVITNIGNLNDEYKRAIAYFALFQACIIKRPYNLFHRKNLYMRTSDVQRSFGNKTTWDTPFDVWFRQFVAEANGCIFSNGRQNVAMNCDAFEIPGQYDLVYIDTPYISDKGVGVDYLHFYHFLEGIVDYDNWARRIDYRSKHRKLKQKKSVWTDKNRIHDAFDRLFEKFQDSILVVSYRDQGIPSPDELLTLLRKHKGNVVEVNGTDYKYVLSNGSSRELLFIAQ
ncbi:MAG: DNA methyltransferase [Chloroflexi bacterium]|nr:DNA methyltransferase [Chloroflexota bacterium]